MPKHGFSLILLLGRSAATTATTATADSVDTQLVLEHHKRHPTCSVDAACGNSGVRAGREMALSTCGPTSGLDTEDAALTRVENCPLCTRPQCL